MTWLKCGRHKDVSMHDAETKTRKLTSSNMCSRTSNSQKPRVYLVLFSLQQLSACQYNVLGSLPFWNKCTTLKLSNDKNFGFWLLLLSKFLWLCCMAAAKSLPAHPFNALILPILMGCLQSISMTVPRR